MSNLNDERETIAGKLNAAGVYAVTDPSVELPAVLVGSPSVLGGQGVGGWTVEYPIQIMSTPPGNKAALEWMLEQLEKALVVFPGQAFPRTIDHLGKDVPGYVLAVSRNVTSPNC